MLNLKVLSINERPRMKNSVFQIFYHLKLICNLSMLFFSFALIGQKDLKYKDVYKVVTEKSKEEAYSLLMVYQKQKPKEANPYFQLGIISQYWSKEYDALTNPKDVDFFIYNTNFYFGLANSKLDQKEDRKNEKFYQNVERFKNVENIDIEAVKIFIQEQIDANNEYKKNVKIVTNYFNQSILHYNNCINIFKEINTSKNKMEDIFLSADKSLLDKLNELQNSFDSTIYYLQNYQTAIKNYPIKNYNQKYKLCPIETFRLQGLTSSDFLQDEIPIWDYGTWVKNAKKVLDNDIKDIRMLITNADNQLNQDINLLVESNVFSDDMKIRKLEDKLKYKIGKFDHKSLLLELFKYKESKIDFLAASRNPLNNPNDTTYASIFPQRVRFYETLVQKKNYCDSLGTSFQKLINTDDLNKYKEFFTNIYGGEAGIKNYCNNEKLLTTKIINNSINNFKDFLVSSSDLKTKRDTIVFKNSKIPLCKSYIGIDNSENGKFYTVDIQQNTIDDYYITGFTKNANNKTLAFVAKTNKLESIKWLQMIAPEKQEKITGCAISIKDEGCDVIFNIFDTHIVRNLIIGFDNDGKQKEKIEVGVPAFPRYFNYDEISQKYLMVFKGVAFNPFQNLTGDLTICQLDALTKQVSWINNLAIKGTFVDLVKLNQDILLFSNFTEYQSSAKKLYSYAGTDSIATNSLLVVLDENGSIKNEIPIINSKPFYIIKSIKINSNSFNLIGFKSQLPKFQTSMRNEQSEFLYLLMNSNGKIYFDNWN